MIVFSENNGLTEKIKSVIVVLKFNTETLCGSKGLSE